VTKSALEGPTWRFARIPSMGVTDAVEILVFLIWQLPHWLLFGCKNSQTHPEEAGRPVCEGTVWSLSVAAEVIVDSRTFFRDDLVEHAKLGGQTRSGQFLPCFASSFFSRLATPVAPRSRA